MATRGDIPVLVEHHCLMFEEMRRVRAEEVHFSMFETMGRSYQEKLEKQMPEEKCTAWVVVEDGRIIASAAVSLVSMVPVPDDPRHEVGYVHSVYTDPNRRNEGHAGRLMEQARGYCNSKGIHRMMLAASEAGRPLYEKMGFETVDNFMRLWVK